MATREEIEYRRQMADGLVVIHRDGSFDAETTAELVAWLLRDVPQDMVLAA